MLNRQLSGKSLVPDLPKTPESIFDRDQRSITAAGDYAAERQPTERSIARRLTVGKSHLAIRATMDYRATISRALCQAQDLLWANLPSAHSLPDGETITQLRQLLRSRDVAEALRAGPDTELAFYLRAGARVSADDRGSDREIITKLWPILDNQALNEALDLEQDVIDGSLVYSVRSVIVELIFSNFRSRPT